MKTSDLKIRITPQLREWIELRSIRHHRSMNAEIVSILDLIRDGENQSAPGEDFFKFAAPSFIFNKSAQETAR